MPTYRLDLAYDGSGFHGYAKQPDLRTVQQELEEALTRILGSRMLGTVRTTVAGRTDAGVHAVGQVVSFDCPDHLDTDKVSKSLNSLLGPEISVLALVEAEPGFSARKDAITRRYRYQIFNRSVADPFRRHETWHVHHQLNLADMDAAAQLFLGRTGLLRVLP